MRAEAITIACFSPIVDFSVEEAVALDSENREGWGETIMDKEILEGFSLEASSQQIDDDFYCLFGLL